MCRVHIHQKAYTPTRYGGISTVHNATDNAHMDKAAQTISRTTQNRAHTAMDYALKTQEMNSRLLQQTSQAWIDGFRDRKSTRLNSSHANISYAVFCLKKKKR